MADDGIQDNIRDLVVRTMAEHLPSMIEEVDSISDIGKEVSNVIEEMNNISEMAKGTVDDISRLRGALARRNEGLGHLADSVNELDRQLQVVVANGQNTTATVNSLVENRNKTLVKINEQVSEQNGTVTTLTKDLHTIDLKVEMLSKRDNASWRVIVVVLATMMAALGWLYWTVLSSG